MTSPPDHDGAFAYAHERLRRELAAHLTYHNLAHTRDDVLGAVERLAAAERISGHDLILLRTGAWYHDLGYIVQARGHEELSAQMAAEVLPRFGYNREDIHVITGLIMATRLPQTPHTRMEQIIADADLDVFGQIEFPRKNQALRDEMAAFNRRYSDREWFRTQIDFLQAHTYFTDSARRANDAQKTRNLDWLAECLAQTEST